MKLLRPLRLVWMVSMLSLLLLCYLFARTVRSSHHNPYAGYADSLRIRRALTSKLLERDHIFVPASSQAIQYVGRWVPTLNRLRRDASFPGARIEFEVNITTSVYLRLRNALVNPHDDDLAVISKRGMSILRAESASPYQSPVSLMVEVDERIRLFDSTGHGALALATDLDRMSQHQVAVTLLDPGDHDSTLQFEGVWVDKGAVMKQPRKESGSLTPFSASGMSQQPIYDLPQGHKPTTAKKIEVVSPIQALTPAQAHKSWPRTLVLQLNASHTVVSTSRYCLTKPCSDITLHDIYFRSGLPSTPHSSLPYRFPVPPSALILDIGLLDFAQHQSTKPSAHATAHFVSGFISAYIALVHTIRTHAYPHSTSTLYAADVASTTALPIFLLTPCTPSKDLHRLFSHTIANIVNTIQAEGDRSTFWIDTSAWLDASDFVSPTTTIETAHRSTVSPRSTTATPIMPLLTHDAHAKVADLLSHYLCPYLASNHAEETACPFNKHDNYRGHLIVPEEEGVGMILAERRQQLIWEQLGFGMRDLSSTGSDRTG